MQLQDAAAARVYDFDGNARVIDTQAYVLDKAASQLTFARWSQPQPDRLAAGVALDVMVGNGDAAIDVPEPLRQAIRFCRPRDYTALFFRSSS